MSNGENELRRPSQSLHYSTGSCGELQTYFSTSQLDRRNYIERYLQSHSSGSSIGNHLTPWVLDQLEMIVWRLTAHAIPWRMAPQNERELLGMINVAYHELLAATPLLLYPRLGALEGVSLAVRQLAVSSRDEGYDAITIMLGRWGITPMQIAVRQLRTLLERLHQRDMWELDDLRPALLQLAQQEPAWRERLLAVRLRDAADVVAQLESLVTARHRWSSTIDWRGNLYENWQRLPLIGVPLRDVTRFLPGLVPSRGGTLAWEALPPVEPGSEEERIAQEIERLDRIAQVQRDRRTAAQLLTERQFYNVQMGFPHIGQDPAENPDVAQQRREERMRRQVGEIFAGSEESEPSPPPSDPPQSSLRALTDHEMLATYYQAQQSPLEILLEVLEGMNHLLDNLRGNGTSAQIRRHLDGLRGQLAHAIGRMQRTASLGDVSLSSESIISLAQAVARQVLTTPLNTQLTTGNISTDSVVNFGAAAALGVPGRVLGVLGEVGESGPVGSPGPLGDPGPTAEESDDRLRERLLETFRQRDLEEARRLTSRDRLRPLPISRPTPTPDSGNPESRPHLPLQIPRPLITE